MAKQVKKPYTLKIDPELLKALRELKERDGVAESEQIRRGIRLWLEGKGWRSQQGCTQPGARKPTNKKGGKKYEGLRRGTR